MQKKFILIRQSLCAHVDIIFSIDGTPALSDHGPGRAFQKGYAAIMCLQAKASVLQRTLPCEIL
jgi:hypothetical protein